jgi:large subunit ribosomal protein L29
MLKRDELKDQSVEELKARNLDLSKEIYSLKNELSTARKLEKPHLLREKKRDRARVLTVLREKE